MIRLMTLSTICLLSSSLILSGCVSYNQKLTNPETGQTYICSAQGFGYIGAPVATMAQHKCIKQAAKKGFV